MKTLSSIKTRWSGDREWSFTHLPPSNDDFKSAFSVRTWAPGRQWLHLVLSVPTRVPATLHVCNCIQLDADKTGDLKKKKTVNPWVSVSLQARWGNLIHSFLASESQPGVSERRKGDNWQRPSWLWAHSRHSNKMFGKWTIIIFCVITWGFDTILNTKQPVNQALVTLASPALWQQLMGSMHFARLAHSLLGQVKRAKQGSQAVN